MSHRLAHPHWLTERCGLVPAPAGLALVQDLLNTRKITGRGTDLLDTVDLARSWLPSCIHDWESDTGRTQPATEWVDRMTHQDLIGLRTVRDDVVALLADDPLPAIARELSTAGLQVAPTGEIRLEPTSSGWHRFAGAIWIEVFLAQRSGTWQRLKVCRNPICGSTFFDRSKNNSGVWHDVKVCGNAANLRASRARKRQAAVDSAARDVMD